MLSAKWRPFCFCNTEYGDCEAVYLSGAGGQSGNGIWMYWWHGTEAYHTLTGTVPSYTTTVSNQVTQLRISTSKPMLEYFRTKWIPCLLMPRLLPLPDITRQQELIDWMKQDHWRLFHYNFSITIQIRWQFHCTATPFLDMQRWF